jgi:hypothetical protein
MIVNRNYISSRPQRGTIETAVATRIEQPHFGNSSLEPASRIFAAIANKQTRILEL